MKITLNDGYSFRVNVNLSTNSKIDMFFNPQHSFEKILDLKKLD